MFFYIHLAACLDYLLSDNGYFRFVSDGDTCEYGYDNFGDWFINVCFKLQFFLYWNETV